MSELIRGLFDHAFTLPSGGADVENWPFEIRIADGESASSYSLSPGKS